MKIMFLRWSLMGCKLTISSESVRKQQGLGRARADSAMEHLNTNGLLTSCSATFLTAPVTASATAPVDLTMRRAWQRRFIRSKWLLQIPKPADTHGGTEDDALQIICRLWLEGPGQVHDGVSLSSLLREQNEGNALQALHSCKRSHLGGPFGETSSFRANRKVYKIENWQAVTQWPMDLPSASFTMRPSLAVVENVWMQKRSQRQLSHQCHLLMMTWVGLFRTAAQARSHARATSGGARCSHVFSNEIWVWKLVNQYLDPRKVFPICFTNESGKLLPKAFLNLVSK